MSRLVETSILKTIGTRRLVSVMFMVIGIGGAALALSFLLTPSQSIFSCTPVETKSFTFSAAAELSGKPQRDPSKLATTIEESYRNQLGKKNNTLSAATIVGPFLQKRKNELITSLYTNPSRAANIIVSGRSIRSIVKGNVNCFEQRRQVTGTIHVLEFEDFTNQKSPKFTERFSITTNKGEVYSLHFLGIPPTNVHEGSVVDLTGLHIDNEIVLDGTATTDKPNSEFGGLSLLEETKKTAEKVANTTAQTVVIPVYYQDQLFAPSTPTLSQISTTMFAEPGSQAHSVNAFYQENSYGQLHVQGVVHDWIQISDTTPSTCADLYNEMISLPTIARMALQQQDPQFRIAEYQHVIFVTNSPCAIGITNYNTGDTVVTLPNATSVYVLAHEFGHQLGLSHAGYLFCDSSQVNPNNISDPRCRDYEYGDWYDIMGGSFVDGGHFNAYHKERLGWLRPENIVTSVAQGTSTITLEPLEAVSNFAKVLKVPRGDGSFLYIEYRQPIGFDEPLQQLTDTNVFAGALLHIHRQNNPDTSLLDPHATAASLPNRVALELGEQFTDPVSGTLLRVTARTPSELTIEVTQHLVDRTRPVLSMTALPTTATGQIEITITATDPESGIKSVVLDAQSQMGQITQTLVDAPYHFTLDTTRLANGPATIWATAMNHDNLSTTISAQTVVLNGDSIAPTVSILTPIPESISTTSSVRFSFDPRDNSGIAEVQYWYQHDSLFPIPIAGEPLYNPPYRIQEGFLNGGVTLFAQAKDYSGNTSAVAQVHFFVQSPQHPNASLLTPQNGIVLNRLSAVETTLSFCPADTVHLRIVMDTYNNLIAEGDHSCSGNNVHFTEQLINPGSVLDGAHTIFVIVSHNINNGGWLFPTNDAVISASIQFDSTNPIVELPVLSKRMSVIQGAVQVQATASDKTRITNLEIQRSLEPNVFGGKTVPIETKNTVSCIPASSLQTCTTLVTWDTTKVQNGVYSIAVLATDMAGNTASSYPVSVRVSNLVTGEKDPYMIPEN